MLDELARTQTSPEDNLHGQCRAACAHAENLVKWLTPNKNDKVHCEDTFAANHNPEEIMAIYDGGGLNDEAPGICGTLAFCKEQFPEPVECTGENCAQFLIQSNFPDLLASGACFNVNIGAQLDSHIAGGLDLTEQVTAVYSTATHPFNFAAVYNVDLVDLPAVQTVGMFSIGDLPVGVEAISFDDITMTATVASDWSFTGQLYLLTNTFGVPILGGGFAPVIVGLSDSAGNLYGVELTVGTTAEFSAPVIDTEQLEADFGLFFTDYLVGADFIFALINFIASEGSNDQLPALVAEIDALGMAGIGDTATAVFVSLFQFTQLLQQVIPQLDCFFNNYLSTIALASAGGTATGSGFPIGTHRVTDASAALTDLVFTCINSAENDACTRASDGNTGQCVCALENMFGLPAPCDDGGGILSCVYDPCEGLAPGAGCDAANENKVCSVIGGGIEPTLTDGFCDFGECECIVPDTRDGGDET